jgi:hypothetical protein
VKLNYYSILCEQSALNEVIKAEIHVPFCEPLAASLLALLMAVVSSSEHVPAFSCCCADNEQPIVVKISTTSEISQW